MDGLAVILILLAVAVVVGYYTIPISRERLTNIGEYSYKTGKSTRYILYRDTFLNGNTKLKWKKVKRKSARNINE